MAPAGTSDWEDQIAPSRDSTSIYVSGVAEGLSYDVRLRTENQYGAYSTWVTVTGHVVNGDNTPPGPPTGVVVTPQTKANKLTWTNPTDADLKQVSIWQSTTNDSSTAAKVVDVLATEYTVTGLTTGVTYYYWMKAQDRSGNVSAFDVGQYAGHAGTPT